MQKYFTPLVALFLLTVFPSNDLMAQKKLSGKSLFGTVSARQIGPAVMSGRVSALEMQFDKSEVIFVGAAGGGLWKTQSGGPSLRPIFDKQNQSIGTVRVDQNHPDTIWVGTGEPWVRNSVSVGDGIYKSTDGGNTWKHKGLPNSERIADILIDPNDPNIVTVAVMGHLWDANEERGIYQTTDGGTTWNKQFYLDENTGCVDLDRDPKNPEILYAAMWSHRRTPWSFDSGFNGKSGLYKSTDNGQTWKQIHNGLPTEKLGRMAIGVAPSNGDRIYLTVEVADKKKKGLYRSEDAGESWEMISDEVNTGIRPFYFSNIVVDPNDQEIVYKCGMSLTISEDGGKSWKTGGGGVHSDIHDVIVDPNNSKHVVIGTDGGVYESLDRGGQFKMWMNLPISQFYHVAVDNAEPYNVYGGLQDNGSWYAPSKKAGGIQNKDWESTFGGDGFHSFRHPIDENIIYSEYQGGNLVRYNQKTGVAKDIKPYPKTGESKFRFNWNTPIHQSLNNPERIYFGAQYLFMSEDRGDSWKRLSPDLTTNNPSKQQQAKSGGLSIDNSTAENHTTIYTIAESPKDEKIIWVGTDDGNLQVSSNGGANWSNVVLNIDSLPANTWVSFIEASPHDAKTVFVTFDNHRMGDINNYTFVSKDLGVTWTKLSNAKTSGYALSIRQDLVNPNLLFLGTEFGLYLSIDFGESWSKFQNNVPPVGIRDMVIHTRDHALVMATHGRGIIIIDDLGPLRQLNPELMSNKFKFMKTPPTYLKDPGSGSSWYGGAGVFFGPNPNTNAKITYFMGKRHTFGKMYIEVFNESGEKIKTLPAGKSAGINIVEMPTRLNPPKAAPSKNRNALFGALIGPNLKAGKYQVKVIKGKESFESEFELKYPEDGSYPLEDRVLQQETVMKIYDLQQDLAYQHHCLDKLSSQSQLIKGGRKLEKKFAEFAEQLDEYKNSLVAVGGDGYVDEEEKLRERIGDIYRLISTYPGKPSESQLERVTSVEAEMEEVVARSASMMKYLETKLNPLLEKAGLDKLKVETMEEFLSQ